MEQPPTVRDAAGSPAGTAHSVSIGVLSSFNLGQHGKKRGARRDLQGMSVAPVEGE